MAALSTGKGGEQAQLAIAHAGDDASFALADTAISQHAAKINAPAKAIDMVKSVIELTGQSLPPRLKANIGKIMSNPWFGSEGKPIRRHVVNLNRTVSPSICNKFPSAIDFSHIFPCVRTY